MYTVERCKNKTITEREQQKSMRQSLMKHVKDTNRHDKAAAVRMTCRPLPIVTVTVVKPETAVWLSELKHRPAIHRAQLLHYMYDVIS